MQWTSVACNWHQFGNRARRAWGSLTEDDVQDIAIKGSRRALVTHLQQRYGWSAAHADAQVSVWLNTLDQRF